MIHILVLALSSLTLLFGCSPILVPPTPSEQLLYVINHLDQTVIVAVGDKWHGIPGKTTRTIRLRDVSVPSVDEISIEVATVALEPQLSRVLAFRPPKYGNAELRVGAVRPLTDSERAGALPAELRDRPKRWTELFENRTPLERTDREESQLAVGTSHPVLKTTHNSIGMRLIRVPAGQFMMGCPPSDPNCHAISREHPVVLTRDYWLSETEVTQEQWLQVMEDNPSTVIGANLPVTFVNWFEAKEFCERLSEREGKRYRLPTEAEWEYACRAGTTTAFSFGESAANLNRYGWYNGNSGGVPQPVAGKLPNPWGFYDMHGNVLEWCEDWFAFRYPAKKQVDPTGPDTPDADPAGIAGRVIRGGRFSFSREICGSAYRDYWPPELRSATAGFRVVLEVTKEP